MAGYQLPGTLVDVPPLSRIPASRRGELIARLEAMTEDQVWEWAHSNEPELAIIRLHFGQGMLRVLREFILHHPPGDAHALRVGLTAWLAGHRDYCVDPSRYMHMYARHTRPATERTCTCQETRQAEENRRWAQILARHEDAS